MSDSTLEKFLTTELERLSGAGLMRRRYLLDSSCGPHVIVDGKEMLAFASNDYLGLAAHPELAQVMADSALSWGAGSGASHLVCGHLRPHEELERRIAAFTGFPRALTFSTGYLANLAIAPALATNREDAIFADRLNHASLIDAAQLARGSHHRYPHADVGALARLLENSRAKTKIIMTDAVFSMDGDLAPLPELFQLAERFDAWLVIDDAHGFGVLGAQGQGSLAHYELPAHHRILLMGTLGKAAGVGGAFIAGSELAIEYLTQKARSYIFTTAQPPAMAGALIKSLELIAAGDKRRAHLKTLIRQLQEGSSALPWKLLPSQTAIQPLIVGDNKAALALSRSLRERGIWAPAIRPPTVPAGTARLRISLSAAHSAADVEQLANALKALA
jgi:8-amino-7-oxononanoate synthase